MTSALSRGTIVVPAHDEAAVIGRCLAALLDDRAPDEYGVLVVSNGSTDATAERARRLPGVGVVEIPVASKTAALRAGFAQANAGSVVVVDADVEVSSATVRALLDALDEDGPVVAAARPRLDLHGTSWVVRHYYAVWDALPYARTASVGSGVYALNGAARALVGEIPDVLNDDGWVRRALPPDRRRVVDDEFTVRVARTAVSLVRRRARVINGNRQLAERFGPDADGAGLRAVRAGLVAHDFGTIDAAAFLAVTAGARLTAWWRRRRGDMSWSTDTSSREAA